jgi:hypothetical protein
MNISSIDRLRLLPEVFTLKTAASMFSWEEKMASRYISRWKRRGLVSSLGERTGVHFNLLKNPSAPSNHFLHAVGHIFPGAVLVGATALHASGATTQIPTSFDVAIPYRPSYPVIPGIDISTRPRAWFRAVHEGLVKDRCLPRLTAELALADAWVNGGWQPDPDDVDFDEIDSDLLKEAFAMFKVDIPDNWSDVIKQRA